MNLALISLTTLPHLGNRWDKAKMVPSSVLLSNLQKLHPTVVKAADELSDTARSYRIPGYTGSFGFISSMSDHFCSSCNRLRLTADGQIKVRPSLWFAYISISLDARRCAYLTRKRYRLETCLEAGRPIIPCYRPSALLFAVRRRNMLGWKISTSSPTGR